MEETQHYESDFEEKEEESVSPQKRGRGKAKTYTKIATFISKVEAEAHLINEKCWRVLCGQKESMEGRKQHYCCTKYTRKNACPVQLYLLFHAEDSSVSMFRSDDEHFHDGITTTRGISADVQKVIEQLFDDKVTKPKQILLALRNRNMELPKLKQLQNLLTKLRNKKYGSAAISMGELEQWCKDNSQIPDDEDTPFVASYSLAEGNGEADSQELHVFMTTLRILQNTFRSEILHTDATYKLVWQGFPVLMIGTTNINRVFHPAGLAVCSSESVADYKFIFKSLSEGITLVTGLEFKPRFLVADGADAITRAFDEVFGNDYVRIMCWFHVLKNIEHNKNFLILPKEIRQELKNDIVFLQLSASPQIFWKGVELFEEKWKDLPGTAEFLVYFRTQWLDKYPNWFEGAAQTVPSTNNALEGTNGVIKAHNTLRQRLPLGQFLQIFQQICGNWSQERNPQNVNHKTFATIATKPLSAWTEAYQWVKQNKTVRQKTTHSATKFFIASSNLEEPLTVQLVTKFEEGTAKLNWVSFAEFVKNRQSIWEVAMSDNKWEDAICTCPKFQKMFYCKHILGMAIRLRLVEVPAAAKNVPIGQKRKRGRPTLAKAALVRQWSNANCCSELNHYLISMLNVMPVSVTVFARILETPGYTM